jgi:hypothetical protein
MTGGCSHFPNVCGRPSQNRRAGECVLRPEVQSGSMLDHCTKGYGQVFLGALLALLVTGSQQAAGTAAAGKGWREALATRNAAGTEAASSRNRSSS